MLVIDGAQLEGGGQIVRMAVCLSALTDIPIQINHIRAKRDTPGLAAQHVTAIRAVASLCDAKTTGVSAGSSTLTFHPISLHRNDLAIDVGTAGSISLVLQAWLPTALRLGGSIRVRGGTEVRNSPTIDYFERIFLRLLQHYGAQVRFSILQRGYYPQGGGLVRLVVEPSKLYPLHLRGDEGEEGIISCSSNLPGHVVKRQAESARERLLEALDVDLPVYLDQRTGVSTGSSCTAWMRTKGGIALGERGLRAEKVGETAADRLIEAARAGGLVDRYLADQMLIYLAQYGGSYTVNTLTLHARTMHWLLSEFGYQVEMKEGEMIEVSA